ncbi:hypothetical protein KC323_g264 [Hortaea werneckii]|nr:hypothetical protein KC323_g264 [Hortaea werneckii]
MYRVFTYILCLVRLRSSVLFGALDLVQRSHELKDTPTGKMPVENPNPKSGQESKHLGPPCARAYIPSDSSNLGIRVGIGCLRWWCSSSGRRRRWDCWSRMVRVRHG